MKTDFNFFRCHFFLNSIALFVFPAIGHWLHLSQENLVCGVLLRFTTPVQLFAAANKYGPQALQIATTVKLAESFMDYSRCIDYCNIL
jgi:uncharacterized membrane protein YadS